MARLHYRTLRENVVDAIRTKILNRELVPGMRIIEQDIATEFGISRGLYEKRFVSLSRKA